MRLVHGAGRTLLSALACCALLLTGCSSLEGTGDKGFVSGNGAVRAIDEADRGEPVELTGEDLDGQPLDLADLRGKPAVVVVWGSWCGPCQAEAPEVVSAAETLDDRAEFVGINIRDASTTPAQAFERTYDIPYSSFFSPDGRALLQFPNTLGPKTIPAFVVLDDEGRIAASILGALPSEQTLVDLVDDVATGSTGTTGG
ncbi:MAG: TlpA disulfide reductase family protein [Nocardioides sp.]